MELNKYTEAMAENRAKIVDDFISKNVPLWHLKTIVRFPFTRFIFGWRVENNSYNADTLDGPKTIVRYWLYRYGKLVDYLKIVEKIKTK